MNLKTLVYCFAIGFAAAIAYGDTPKAQGHPTKK